MRLFSRRVAPASDPRANLFPAVRQKKWVLLLVSGADHGTLPWYRIYGAIFQRFVENVLRCLLSRWARLSGCVTGSCVLSDKKCTQPPCCIYPCNKVSNHVHTHTCQRGPGINNSRGKADFLAALEQWLRNPPSSGSTRAPTELTVFRHGQACMLKPCV